MFYGCRIMYWPLLYSIARDLLNLAGILFSGYLNYISYLQRNNLLLWSIKRQQSFECPVLNHHSTKCFSYKICIHNSYPRQTVFILQVQTFRLREVNDLPFSVVIKSAIDFTCIDFDSGSVGIEMNVQMEFLVIFISVSQLN